MLQRLARRQRVPGQSPTLVRDWLHAVVRDSAPRPVPVERARWAADEGGRFLCHEVATLVGLDTHMSGELGKALLEIFCQGLVSNPSAEESELPDYFLQATVRHERAAATLRQLFLRSNYAHGLWINHASSQVPAPQSEDETSVRIYEQHADRQRGPLLGHLRPTGAWEPVEGQRTDLIRVTISDQLPDGAAGKVFHIAAPVAFIAVWPSPSGDGQGIPVFSWEDEAF